MADTSLLGAGVFLLVAGIATGAIAIRAQSDHRRWCEGKARADGVVSRVAARRSQGLSEDAAGMPTGTAEAVVAVVRFRAANRIEYEIDAEEVPLEVGRAVPVAYDPALPSGARAVERAPKVAIPIALLAIGAGLAVIGAMRE